MDKKVLLIIASKGFQPIEYGTPKSILENAGVTVVTASDGGAAVAADSSTAPVDLLIKDINVDDYDGIFLIGGPGALEHLDNKEVYKVVREADEKKMPYGAICISPRILAKAGVLKGRRVTGWDGDGKLKGIVESVGAEYSTDGAVIDNNMVSGSGPAAAADFAQSILQVI